MRTEWKDPFAAGSATQRADAVKTLLLAAAATIALYFIPYAGYLTYPIRLLVTFIHEGSHALMGLLSGGSVLSVTVSPDGSGLTYTTNPNWLASVLTSSAGYLGATLFGAGLIGLLRRGVPANKLLFGTGAAVGAVTLGVIRGILFPGNWGAHMGSVFFALFWGLALTAALVIAGLKLSKPVAGWVASFIGVQCVLNALFDLKTLFGLSVTTMGGTDAFNMFRLTMIPAPFWAALWIAMSFGMLWFVLRPSRR